MATEPELIQQELQVVTAFLWSMAVLVACALGLAVIAATQGHWEGVLAFAVVGIVVGIAVGVIAVIPAPRHLR